MSHESFPLPAELHTRILSYLDPVSLQRAGLTSKAMHQISMDPALWRAFLAKDLRGAAEPRLEVIKAIREKEYIKLTPECLLKMLYARTVSIDVFDLELRARYDEDTKDKIVRVIYNLKFFSKHQLDDSCLTIEQIGAFGLDERFGYFRELFSKYGFKPQDFAMLTTEQIESLPSNYSEILFITCRLKPQDFAMLAAEQIKSLPYSFSQDLFVTCKLKPTDFAMLTAAQIDSVPYYHAKDLFVICGLKPQDLAMLTSEQLGSFLFLNAEDVFVALGLKPQDFAMLTVEQMEVWYSYCLFDVCKLKPQEFALLTKEQIIEYALYAENLFGKCGVTPKAFIEMLKEQVNAILLSDCAEDVLSEYGFTLEDCVGLTQEHVIALLQRDCAKTLFGAYGLKPQNLTKLSPEFVFTLSRADLTQEQVKEFLAHATDEMFTPEYLASIDAAAAPLPHDDDVPSMGDDANAADDA